MKQILTALLTAALLLTGCAGRPSGSETGSYSAGTAEQTVPAGAVCAYDTAWEPAAPSAGMPAAAGCQMLAEKYDIEVSYASLGVCLSTILCMATIPLLMLVL